MAKVTIEIEYGGRYISVAEESSENTRTDAAVLLLVAAHTAISRFRPELSEVQSTFQRLAIVLSQFPH